MLSAVKPVPQTTQYIQLLQTAMALEEHAQDLSVAWKNVSGKGTFNPVRLAAYKSFYMFYLAANEGWEARSATCIILLRIIDCVLQLPFVTLDRCFLLQFKHEVLGGLQASSTNAGRTNGGVPQIAAWGMPQVIN